MCKYHGNGVKRKCSLKGKSHINWCLRYASTTELLIGKDCILLVELDYPKFFMLEISKMRLNKIKNRLAAAELNAVEEGAYGGVPIQKPLRNKWP
tara:strand:- start:444 stop:728 length:285 start_codon:yes stop_codon:yes gene_type:complete